MIDFIPFPKMARLNRDIVVTEKIDGTNAQVYIKPHTEILLPDTPDPTAVVDVDGYRIWAGSRTRWIVPGDDNFGFARWVQNNAADLVKLGSGSHFGEWWGKGIQRGYGMDTRKFSLFNTARWYDDMNHEKLCPPCCDVVPILYTGPMDQYYIQTEISTLLVDGSRAAPGYMNPEGVVVFHTAANLCFKVTCKNDEKPKGQV